MSSSERHPDNSSHLMPAAPAPSKAPQGAPGPGLSDSTQPQGEGGKAKRFPEMPWPLDVPIAVKSFSPAKPHPPRKNESNIRMQLHSPSPSKVGRVWVYHHTPKPAPQIPRDTSQLPRWVLSFCLQGRIPGTTDTSICSTWAWHCSEVGPHAFRP